MWYTLKKTLKNVVKNHKDKDAAKDINDELDKTIAKCKNDDERINQMVKTLEEEHIGTKTILEWFVEVLKDKDVIQCFKDLKVDDAKRQKLITDIDEKISKVDAGPVPKNP